MKRMKPRIPRPYGWGVCGRCIYCGETVGYREGKSVINHEIEDARPWQNGPSGPWPRTAHRNCYLKHMLGKRWVHHRQKKK